MTLRPDLDQQAALGARRRPARSGVTYSSSLLATTMLGNGRRSSGIGENPTVHVG